MIKRILVPTDGSEQAAVGVRYAISMAKRHEAQVLGLYVVDIKLLEGPFLRDISASLGTAPFVNYQGNIANLLEKRGEAALGVLRSLCEEERIPCEAKQVTGTVAHSIAMESELADAIVIGRAGEHHAWLEGLLGSTTEAVIRRAACPVLVTDRGEATLTRVVTAYDGSSNARKALHLAAELCTRWSVPLELLIVHENGEALTKEANEYLDAYEVDKTVSVRLGDGSETIVEFTNEIGADLLVMGAFGHSKVRALVVGSTTAYAVHNAPCPVLLTR